jgi:hypothetical protein
MFGEIWWAVSDWVRRVPRGWRYAGAAALVLLLVLAVAGVVGGGDSSPRKAEVAGTTSRSGAGTVGATMLRRDGYAVLGVMHSDDGAAAAALSYMGQRNALQTGGTSAAVAAEIGSKIAVGGHDVGRRPASIPDQAADVNAQAMLATRQGTLIWRTVPIAYRVRSYTGRRAVVRVFSAALNVYSPGQGASAMGFSLRDMTLVWANGAWRIRSVEETRDQPTPGLIAAVNTSRQVRDLPIEDRMLSSTDGSATGLFSWLNASTPVTVGPAGMGPVDGNVPAGPDERFVAELQRGYTNAAARDRAEDAGSAWTASSPVAYQRVQCPRSVKADMRCYELLSTTTTIEGQGIALMSMSLGGIAVSTDPQTQGSVPFDVPADRQRDVLGAPITIASAGLPDARTTNAAWRRSAMPLQPTIPGGPK